MRVNAICLALCCFFLTACNSSGSNDSSQDRSARAQSPNCQFVQSGYGPKGTVNVVADTLVTGLEIPWGIAFLPTTNDMLVTERPGRIRLIRGGTLVSANVATVTTGESTEGGLLGIALDPAFSSNRYFYIYYTTNKNGSSVNRIQRYTLSGDETQATAGPILIDDIPSGAFHDGGRIKFGPDGKLYASVGDAENPPNGQNPNVPNGKILRLNTDGSIPSDNPSPGKPWFMLGVRNSEGFDWLNSTTMIVADHGPTGELGETGADKVIFGQSGSNLGWPTIYQCQSASGLVSPAITWNEALPPGGAVIYRGNAIPEWKGDLIVGVLGIEPGGANQLHRVMLARDGSATVTGHEVYFEGDNGQGGYGRLRDVVQGPDGLLYVTTSNCDTRGNCPPQKDVILRIHHG